MINPEEFKPAEDAAVGVEEIPAVHEAVAKLVELFHKMIDKLPWFSELEQKAAHDTIGEALAALDPDKELPVDHGEAKASTDEANAKAAASYVAQANAPVPPTTDDTGGNVTHGVAANAPTTDATVPVPDSLPVVGTGAAAPDQIGGGIGDPALEGTPMPDDVAAWLAANGLSTRVVTAPLATGDSATA
jgi:hypothetical protein